MLAISGDKLVSVASVDYESVSSISVTVRSTDSGSPALFVEKTFTISVVDKNDPPSDIALSSSSVDENVAVGTEVGTLSTTDQVIMNEDEKTLL